MSHSSQSSDCPPLMEACTLNLFEKNIFRITGLPVDATTKEVGRQAQKLQMLEEMGGGTPTPVAFPLTPAPTTEQIREALARMKEPERRLVDEFFWYWPETFGDSKNDPAIQALQAGNGQQAVDIWVERENVGSVTATHNLAVMFHMFAVDWTNHHLGHQEEQSRVEKQDSPWAPPKKRLAILDSDRDEKIKGYWKEAFDRWEQLADADDLWEVVKGRVRSLEDEALTIGFVRRMRAFLPQAFDRINAEAALKFAENGRMDWAQFHVDFMRQTHSGLDDVDCTAEIVLAPTKRRVEQRLHSAKAEVDRHPEKGTQVAHDLMSHCRPLMALFDLFHGADSHQRSDLFDEVAQTVANVVISYQKATGDNKAFVEILQQALDFASGSQIRERLIKNIAIGEGNLAANLLEPFFKSLASITGGSDAPPAKLQKLRAQILPQLPNLAIKLGSASHPYQDLMDTIALAFRELSIESHNENRDYVTAEECIHLAAKFAISSEVKIRIQGDLKALSESKSNYKCLVCNVNHPDNGFSLKIPINKIPPNLLATLSTEDKQRGFIEVPRCKSCATQQGLKTASSSSGGSGCLVLVLAPLGLLSLTILGALLIWS